MKEKDPHKVTVVLRDWSKSKTKKGNKPVAEIHSNTKRKETLCAILTREP